MRVTPTIAVVLHTVELGFAFVTLFFSIGITLIAPFTIEGACNRTVFETWLEKLSHSSAATRKMGDFG
jgi:hypothetical protein